ncbi:MAG: hypothetical protein ACI4AW_08330 [Paludibacteraceae bacterium]
MRAFHWPRAVPEALRAVPEAEAFPIALRAFQVPQELRAFQWQWSGSEPIFHKRRFLVWAILENSRMHDGAIFVRKKENEIFYIFFQKVVVKREVDGLT